MYPVSSTYPLHTGHELRLLSICADLLETGKLGPAFELQTFCA